MSTDEELARALREAEAQAPVDAANTEVGAAVSSPPPPEPPRRNVGLLIGLLVIVGGIITLVMTGVDNAAIYSMGVDQLEQKRDTVKDRNLRVDGKLVSGTLVKRTTPCEYRFSIEKNGKQLDVHYPQCVVPDTFRDVKGVEVLVTAEGRLAADGHLQATQIFAKCPSKYDMKEVAKTTGMPEGKGMDDMLIAPRVVDN